VITHAVKATGEGHQSRLVHFVLLDHLLREALHELVGRHHFGVVAVENVWVRGDAELLQRLQPVVVGTFDVAQPRWWWWVGTAQHCCDRQKR